MGEFISRTEFEDVVRHLTTKLDQREEMWLKHFDRVAALEASIIAAHFSIRLLGRLLRPLLSDEQQELLALEQRAGVTDSALESDPQREANDGNEWRRRLERESLARREARDREARDRGPCPESTVNAMKDLGALLNVDAGDEGPCYDRDNRPPSML